MTLVGGSIAFVFGVGEALLLKNMLFSFTAGRYGRAAVILLVKLISYGAAALLLVFRFPGHIVGCAVGYALGLPAAVVVWFLYQTVRGKKTDLGDETNENSNNH